MVQRQCRKPGAERAQSEPENEKRVHLEQPWASGPRFFPLPQGQIAVTLRDAQACFNLNALAQPTTASRPLAVQQLIA